MKFKAIKGTRDILPPDSALWNRVEQSAREVFESYGFGEIRLPIFEQTELFARSIGSHTEVVSKEMYTFEDRSEEIMDPLGAISLPDYVNELERNFLEGRIPKHFVNEQAIRRLKEFVSGLMSKIGSGVQAWPPEKVREYFNEIWYAFSLIRTISLGEKTSLRPEATASVCRAYIEHGMHTRPGNVKLYYIGPMFRRERPQKGRYRQFYQIGAEVLGPSDAPAIDAEVIEMLMHFFARVGLCTAAGSAAPAKETRQRDAGGTTLCINSIGCKECRPKYVAALKTALEKVKDNLGADSQRRIETNPLRVLDSKLESEQAVIETLPRIGDFLCDACRAHFAAVQAQLKLRGIPYEINWRLVRGLDYYMRTTFEITAPGLGAQNAVCGGGRYDGLVELLGGPKDVKGIGFAIGTDRLMLSLQETLGAQQAASLDVFIAWMGASTQEHAIRVARTLRDAGLRVEIPPEEMKFRKALDLASRLGTRYTLILGEDELKSGQYTLKRMADGTQERVAAAGIVARLKNEEKA